MKPIRNLSICLTALGLAACSENNPTSAPTEAAPRAAEQIVAVESGDAAFWWGSENGVFWLELDPTITNVITSGENQLTIPANSICDIETSGYGQSTWNRTCAAETSRVRITIKPSRTIDGRTRMDFYPHIRFSPSATPMLRLYDPSRSWQRSFEILYCASELDQSIAGGCVNEALTDPSLQTFRNGSYFFRKLKHFSGYEVAAT